MEVLYKRKAAQSLEKIILFVENINTPESGKRFFYRFTSTIASYALSNATYNICNNEILASLGYSCIFIEKWVIAFKIENNKFIVYRIIWGPSLT